MNSTHRLLARIGSAGGVLGGLLIACTPPQEAQTVTPATDPATTTTSTPPLVRGEPIREWSFSEFRGDALDRVEVDADIQVGDVLHELHDFGPTFRDTDVFDPDGTSLPSDGIATGPDRLHRGRPHLLGGSRSARRQRQRRRGADRRAGRPRADAELHQARAGRVAFGHAVGRVHRDDRPQRHPAADLPRDPRRRPALRPHQGPALLRGRGFHRAAGARHHPLQDVLPRGRRRHGDRLRRELGQRGLEPPVLPGPPVGRRGLRLRDRQPRRAPGGARPHDPAGAPDLRRGPVLGRRR